MFAEDHKTKNRKQVYELAGFVSTKASFQHEAGRDDENSSSNHLSAGDMETEASKPATWSTRQKKVVKDVIQLKWRDFSMKTAFMSCNISTT